jgi:cytochrome c553
MKILRSWRASRAKRWRHDGRPDRTAAVLALMIHFIPASHAGLEEGRVKSQVCAACHGVDGNSVSSNIPSLAAQPSSSL